VASPEQLEAAMLRSLRQNQSMVERTFYDDVVGFYHAVDWTESWLVALGGFHLVVWALVLLTWRSNEAQMVLLISLLALVYSAEWLNSLGSRHWKEFATQDYFDRGGVFIAAVYCAPMLLAAFVILVNALRSAAHMLVKVKRLEVRAAKRSARAPAASSGAAAGAGAKKEQ